MAPDDPTPVDGIPSASPPRRRRRRWRAPDLGDDRGDVAATVILAGLTVLLVMLVVQLGMYFHGRSVMNAAAQDGARAAQVENATAADASAAAEQILAGSTNLLRNRQITVDRSLDEVTVTITAEVQSVFPGWTGALSATASGPTERFRSQADR